MAEFQPAVEKLLRMEGGYSPADNLAGPVKYGITAQFLRRIGLPSSDKDVRNLTESDAICLYQAYFWDRHRIGEIEDQRTAELLFISAVNMGGPKAVRFLQEAANKLGCSLKVDGRIGPVTLNAINSLTSQNKEVLIWNYKQLLEGWYRYLARSNPSLYGDDLPGWLARLNAV